MRVGVFSVIDWTFLDQRPQVLAKKISEWGHEVIYFEPFVRFQQWNDTFKHPWKEYEGYCWKTRSVYPGVSAVMLMNLPMHKILGNLLKKNEEYFTKNEAFIKSLNLDLAIIIDPALAPMLKELNIPFIYDHVDDTHQMQSVVKDFWFHAQKYAEHNAISTMYIQPNMARRYGGLYVSNGVEPSQLELNSNPEKTFDAGCLSAIADWFDIESVLNTKKKMLIIGPMNGLIRNEYNKYRNAGNKNVTWIPRVSRRVGAQWLKRCHTAMVPFRDDHAIVDYVMPLKLVEYFYLGLPSISYLNKGIEEEFADKVVFYSNLNWRGLPSLDEAIDIASGSSFDPKALKETALKFTWDKVLAPLESLMRTLETYKTSQKSFSQISKEFVAKNPPILLSRTN